MSERTDSQIIHEARGLEWERFYANDNKRYIDLSCNPDYTDPTPYLEAMAWARTKPWWTDFAYEKSIYNSECVEFDEDLLDPPTGAPKLAEFLEGREG